MKTSITFLDHATGEPSDCGAPLVIETSSAGLDWEGFVVEQGSSPHFHPRNVVTPGFYFALATEAKFSWSVESRFAHGSLTTDVGQIWINPPDTPFTHTIDEPCHFILLSIGRSCLLRHFDGALPRENLQFLGDYNIEDRNIQAFMELLLREASTRNANGPAYVSHLLRAFSAYFVRNYSNHADLLARSRSSSAFDEDRLARVETYITEHMEGEFGIDDLARLCGMSRYYFLKEFRKATGTTPYQHVLRRKLEHSRELLRTEKIATVAHRLGFSDQSHFGNAFKKMFGTPPGGQKSF